MRRFNPRRNGGTFTPGKLRDTHREVLRLVAAGMKQVDVAEHMNVSPAMVCYTMKSELGKEQLERLRAMRDGNAVDVQAEIAAAQGVAFATLLEFLVDQNHDKRERRAIAQDLLDRGGNSAVKRVDITRREYGPERIAAIKRKALERARAQGVVVDAEIISEEDNG
jgi:predicted transcriptional regulator